MPRVLRLFLALLLVLSALTLPAPRPAKAVTRVVLTGITDIVVQLPIILVVGSEAEGKERPHPARPNRKVLPSAYFQGEIQRFWDGLRDFKYRSCFSIAVDVSVTQHVRGAGTPSEAHLVVFDPNPVLPMPNSPPVVTDPFNHNSGWTLATGGEYGVPSEPYYAAAHRWQWGPAHQATGPYLGLPGTVGVIDQSLVDRLGAVLEEQLEQKGTPLPKSKKCLHATQEFRDTIEGHPTHNHVRHGFLEVWAAPDEEGNLTGTATFVYEESGWNESLPEHPRCDYVSTAETRGLDVSGRWDQSSGRDYVELEVTGEYELRSQGEAGTLCEFTPEVVFPFAVDPNFPLAGELTDGKYEDEQTMTYVAGHTLVSHTVIEVKVAEEAVA